jgi:hypothetical protein
MIVYVVLWSNCEGEVEVDRVYESWEKAEKHRIENLENDLSRSWIVGRVVVN